MNILFLCTGNSCRSQMAEAWARALSGGRLEPYSAGIRAGGVDPLAVEAMAEAGIDISGHKSKTLGDLAAMDFDVVVMVCAHAAENCPLFPGKAKVIRAFFDDPPRLAIGAATHEEALGHYRRVRDEIKQYVQNLVEKLDEHECR